MQKIKRITLLLIFLFASSLSAQTTKIFWANQSDGKIQSAKLDGTQMIDLVTGLIAPDGLAIDDQSTPPKVYYCERSEQRLSRANLDGTNQEEVITGVVGIRDFELDLVHRKIYWVRDSYNDDAVQRADMDGLNSNIEDMYKSTYTGYDFLGIGLDVTHSKVYWVQRNNGCDDKIVSMNFDKTEATYVVKYPDNSLLGPWDIDVYGDKIYWVDCGVGQDIIYKANLDGSNIDTVAKEMDCQYFVIDPVTEKLYFSEGSYIESIKLDGTGRDTIAIGIANSITGISISHNAPLAIPNNDEPIKSCELHQNYPNPFNPSTVISWQLATGSSVNLSIYNLLGQKVCTLVSEKQKAGNHNVKWNAGDFPSGIYFYKLETDIGFSQTKKLMLIK